MFHWSEVPVAWSGVELLCQDKVQVYEPPMRFIILWVSFNNIYTTLSDRVGRRREVKRDKGGVTQSQIREGRVMPKTVGPTEREELEIAFSHFDDELKHKLISHYSTRFFVDRSPKFDGQSIEFDGLGQRLNGVLNVGYTIDEQQPVWSPIDSDLYGRYIEGEHSPAARDILARQILNVLYTIRCNVLHGGKRFDDRNDREVLESAIPLLLLIVSFFLPETNHIWGTTHGALAK